MLAAGDIFDHVTGLLERYPFVSKSCLFYEGLWVGEISKAPYGILPRKRFENNLSTFIMLVLTPKTHKSDWKKEEDTLIAC